MEIKKTVYDICKEYSDKKRKRKKELCDNNEKKLRLEFEKNFKGNTSELESAKEKLEHDIESFNTDVYTNITEEDEKEEKEFFKSIRKTLGEPFTSNDKIWRYLYSKAEADFQTLNDFNYECEIALIIESYVNIYKVIKNLINE